MSSFPIFPGSQVPRFPGYHLPSECELMWVRLSVSLYLVITFLVTVGTLHRLLSVSIVVHQKLQQTVLRREGAIPFHDRWVSVAKTDIQRA